MTHDVVIVGGGLDGLCCARRVEQQGVRYLILEQSHVSGGRIRTDTAEGVIEDFS